MNNKKICMLLLIISIGNLVSLFNYFNIVSSSLYELEGRYTTLKPYTVTISFNDMNIGSGVLTKDNYIITNYHVIDEIKFSITVKHGNKEYKAKIIKESPEEDLALLKIISEDKPIVNDLVINYNQVKVGTYIFNIGTPLGFRDTFGIGVISNINVTNSITETNVYTISSGVMPGSSGSGVFNINNELVGIVFAMHPDYNNFGLVIPTSTIKKVFGEYL